MTLGAVVGFTLGAFSFSSAAPANSDKLRTMKLRPSPCVAMSGSGWTAAGGFSPSSMEFPLDALKPSYWPSEVPSITFHVDVTDFSGKSLSHSMILGAMPGSCRVFFSKNGRYLAIGIPLHLGASEWLSISVFDTQTRNWLRAFDVKAGQGLNGPLQFEGFLESSSSLVVTGFGNTGATTKDLNVIGLLFSVDGGAVEPHETVRLAGPGMEYAIVNAGNNRLWIRGGPKGYCPLRAVTLTGPLVEGPKVDSDALDGLVCGSPLDAVGFVSSNTIVGESVRESAKREMQSWVWRVDLDRQMGDKVKLPKPGFSLFTAWRDYRLGSRVSVSADGAVFAIGRSITNWAIDEPWYGPTDIAVAQVNPLRLLGTVHQTSCHDLGAFAVGHQSGNTTLLAYWCGKLQRTVIHDPK
jgi:hypothetical protein